MVSIIECSNEWFKVKTIKNCFLKIVYPKPKT
jgi:hypothetical protein